MSVPATQFATPDRFHPADGTGTLIRPLAFGGQAGWLHTPAGPLRGEAAVLICAPPGRDGRCGHRPLRILAERLAGAGYPVLRFDLHGVGDSLDPTDPEADVLPDWLAGVAAAAEALRAATDTRRLVVLGLRLGASLAASVEIGADGMVLLAPVASGRQWLRELKLAGAMSRTGSLEGAADLESQGLRLSSASVAGLGQLDLARLEHAPPQALVVAHNPTVGPVAERLADLGVEVSACDFAGYDALFEDTHSQQTPSLVFDQVLAWMADRFPGRLAQDVTALHIGAEPVALHPPGCIEHPVHFGPGLNGVLCLPDEVASDGRAVIFCNTSAEPRAGVGRFAVEASRSLASHGVASLRFDFAGIGDSDGPDQTHVYSVSRQSDLSDAVTLLAAEGFPEVALASVCSGSFHTLRALAADPRVGGVFSVSGKLVWREGESVRPDMRDEGRATQVYVSGLKDPQTWRRLLTGKIDVAAVLKTLWARLLGRLAAGLHQADGRALREGLAEAADRGARIHLLMGLDDASYDELQAHFGAGARKLLAMPGASIHVEPRLDHGLARAASRRIAIAELLNFMGAA